jgi:hypothetical protein
MDVVMVPLVWPGTPVGEALELLKRRERSGLVVQNPDESYHLLYAGDLLRARAAGVSTVGEVERRHRVLTLNAEWASTYALDLVTPRRTGQNYERFLATEGAEYALAGDSYDTVMIVTHHEGQTEALTMTGGYRCTGTPTHYFPEPRVSSGEQCPLYPECSQKSGVPHVVPD